jgi:hypothetical protein
MSVNSVFQRLGWLVLLLVIAQGCSGSGDGSAPLRGTVLLRGQPIQVRGRSDGLGWVKLKLLPADVALTDTSKIVEAGVSESGEFQIQKHNGNGKAGLLPGKYRLGLEVEDQGKRLYPEYDLTRSKLLRDLKPGDENLVLDFAGP